MHINIIINEMYSQNNNSDQIFNMYTVTQKTARCIKNSGIDNKRIFNFPPNISVQTFFTSINI